jgi:hypothetical protein
MRGSHAAEFRACGQIPTKARFNSFFWLTPSRSGLKVPNIRWGPAVRHPIQKAFAVWLFGPAGALLVIAGLLKVILAESTTTSSFYWVGWGEIPVGVAIITGSGSRIIRVAALAAFSGLFGAACFMLARGESACNCFGQFSLSPKWVVLLDGMIIVAMFSTVLSAQMNSSSLHGLTLCVGLTILITAGSAFVGYAILRANWAGGAPTILTLDSWTESAQRIFEDADIGRTLRSGEWIILLHTPGCPDCGRAREVVYGTATKLEGGPRYATVAVGQNYDDLDADIAVASPSTVTKGRLRTGAAWIVRTPLFLHARDGIVDCVSVDIPQP